MVKKEGIKNTISGMHSSRLLWCGSFYIWLVYSIYLIFKDMHLMLKVTCENPPIPLRRFDYSVTKEDYDQGDHISYGETKEEALKDYLEYYSDKTGIDIKDIKYSWV